MSSDAGIEQLRLLPDDEIVEFLTTRREDQWLDRKSARVAARQLGDILVAFANAEGGLVVIGINAGRVEGVGAAGARVNDWRQAAVDYTEPPVRHRFELVPCTNAAGDQDSVVVIEVESSDRVHTNVRGETFLRIGDENRRLGIVEAQELRFDKGESTYDGSPVASAELSDIDAGLVARYVRRIRASSGDVALAARGLIVERRNVVRPTVAGLLTLGSQPQREFPEAFVRLLRYQGSSRETGTRLNVVADRRLEGPIPAQIDAARRLLRRWLPAATRLERSGHFGSSTLIPEHAWLEAIVNAVTHRSYSIGGDHIRVELFDDRLEVESPGRLPGLVRLENIRSTRFARNPRIARALSDLGYGRELGEGVNRMFEEMRRAGLPDPVYHQGPASVRVVLLADPVAARILDRLPRGSERFVEHLSRVGRITTTEAADLLGASRPTVLRHLHELETHGLIEHVGTSLKDPRGYWRVSRGN